MVSYLLFKGRYLLGIKAIVIKVKEVPIKIYNNIKKVERYYILLYCVYKIISLELKGTSKELTL